MDGSDMLRVKAGEPRVWFCPGCKAQGKDTKLGIHDGEVLRVKHKDLYIEFEGEGKIVRNCHVCGKRCEVKSLLFDRVQEMVRKFNESLRGESQPSQQIGRGSTSDALKANTARPAAKGKG